MIATAKRWILQALERAGYVVMRKEAFNALQAQLSPAATTDDCDHQLDAEEYHARCGMQDMAPAFLPIFERCRSCTMTSASRMYAVYQAVRFLGQAGVSGDIVECGVWRGGSMMVAAETLLAEGDTSRRLWLYDTFAGLPLPDRDVDVDVFGNQMVSSWSPHRTSDESSQWAYASVDEVRRNMQSTGFPEEQVRFVVGMVEQTIPQEAPQDIALLRIDTDWYQSTRHILAHLFPRLSENGVLILDDYGHLLGARRAVDEYFAESGWPMLLHRVDYSGRVGIKTAWPRSLR